MPLIEAFLRDPAFGWDYARMVHGDQSITLHRPVFAGDELVTTIHVEDLAARAGSHMLTLRCAVADVAGAPGATTKAVLGTQARRPGRTPWRTTRKAPRRRPRPPRAPGPISWAT